MEMHEQGFIGKGPKSGKHIQKAVKKEVHAGIKYARNRVEDDAIPKKPSSSEEGILMELSSLPLKKAKKEIDQLISLNKNLTRKAHKRESKESHKLKPKEIPHFHATAEQVHPKGAKWHNANKSNGLSTKKSINNNIH